MTKPAHTPGPWRIKEGPRHTIDSCDLTIAGDIFLLADINGPNYPHCHPNAHLIAAAPELYEACEAALGAFENNNNIDWSILSDALKKARGEAC